MENIYPQVLFTSKNCEISIEVLLIGQLRLLTRLNISGCDITDQQADRMTSKLLETISPQNLELSNTMLKLSKTIINNSLKIVSSLKNVNISNDDIDDSTTAVTSSNSLIVNINLSHNNLSNTGVLNIANALSEQIKVLDISNNFIVSDNITDLVAAVSKLPILQELYLSHNLLALNNVLTIAQIFRNHPTLQTLNLCGNINLFFSACEFIVNIILSVNQNLINLNVCGRNFRLRCIEDCSFSPSSNNYYSGSLLRHYLLQCSTLHTTNIQAKFIKVEETCPIPSEDIISYYVDNVGGVFYNQDHDFGIVIPPGAVSQGEYVEIQATANYFGPYIIPDGFYPISSCFWVSANYTFNVLVYVIMNHYAKIRNLKDISNLHVLQKCKYSPSDNMMSIIPDGVYFDNENGYFVLATEHFCTYCGAKSDKDIPEYLTACYYTFDEPSSRSLIAEVCFYPSSYSCRKVHSYI